MFIASDRFLILSLAYDLSKCGAFCSSRKIKTEERLEL